MHSVSVSVAAFRMPPPCPNRLPAEKLPRFSVSPRNSTVMPALTNITGATAKVLPVGWFASTIVLDAPAPTSVTLRLMQRAVVVIASAPPLSGSRKKQGPLCVKTYVPAGTLIVLASSRPLARARAPRRLQSPEVASSHADSAASSVVVSTFRTAARAGTAQASPTARLSRTSRKRFAAFIDPLLGGGCSGPFTEPLPAGTPDSTSCPAWGYSAARVREDT